MESERKRVESIALSYYSRKEVQNAIFEFCKNRETIANFANRFFAKRPDCLDYPTDIINLARQGATSFHCSEEIWKDPLKIKTGMTREEYNDLRIGWDLLLDIDSKYLDYSKIAARVLIKALRYHGVRNFSVKFSGSKGFHILVPFKAFPDEVAGKKTKDYFPEWARIIAGYLKEITEEEITKRIMDSGVLENSELVEVVCQLCKTRAESKKIGRFVCRNIRCQSVVESMKSNRKEMICPSCNGKMHRESEVDVHFCPKCNTNSRKSPQAFEEKKTARELIDVVDVVLVASRHLFRAPYSLHEKTSLASIVITEDEIDGFEPRMADPLKLKDARNFMPDCIKGEARNLLLQALDSTKKEKIKDPFDKKPIDLKGITITEDMFPPVIKKILKGVKRDGRKRALSLLLTFFSSLGFSKEYIEEKIRDWNKKNYSPLKEGYVRSQIEWHARNKRMPPNYDKPVYALFGITSPPEPGIKNPVNYTIRLALRKRKKSREA
ncbi:hypothetical protein D6829_00355 [Candidatus Pacearchaeota archaeon]|nr:MAG: hypothetical protein D6829_00355 [Candidatus Pacearchaeota archaeon]